MLRKVGMGCVVALMALGLAAPNALAMSEWRTEAQSSIGSGTGLIFDQDFGLNQATASTMLTTSGAHSEAFATLSPSGFIPTLKALAIDGGTRAQAVAWGVQSYTNTSGAVLDTSLILTLTADIVGANDVSARIYLFEDADFEYSRDPGTILFESTSVLWPGFAPFANNPGPLGFDVLISNTEGPVNEMRQFDFSVGIGESFYVWAMLLATADQTGEVDAFSTLTASFTNTEGLTPAANAIPEPAAAWLLVGGLALLYVRRRPRYR